MGANSFSISHYFTKELRVANAAPTCNEVQVLGELLLLLHLSFSDLEHSLVIKLKDNS